MGEYGETATHWSRECAKRECGMKTGFDSPISKIALGPFNSSLKPAFSQEVEDAAGVDTLLQIQTTLR